MQINITARHFDLTDAIKNYVNKEVEKLFTYFDRIISVSVIISYERDRSSTEIVVNAPKMNIRSKGEDTNLYKSIDSAVDKSEHQLKKIREKKTNHSHKKDRKRSRDMVFANLYRKERQSSTPKIQLTTRKFIANTLNVDEAIESLEDSNEFYCVFRNIQTDRLNVLIKKDSQHYKLLELTDL